MRRSGCDSRRWSSRFATRTSRTARGTTTGSWASRSPFPTAPATRASSRGSTTARYLCRTSTSPSSSTRTAGLLCSPPRTSTPTQVGRSRSPGATTPGAASSGLGENDKEKWFTDPRIPAIHQLPDRFFDKDRASFDKGHIVRREDVAWGDTFDQVRRANGDTYHVTNCSPQIASFNRSRLQGGRGQLENLILKQAKTERYSLFAGPVFRDDDRVFRGVDDDGTIRVVDPAAVLEDRRRAERRRAPDVRLPARSGPLRSRMEASRSTARVRRRPGVEKPHDLGGGPRGARRGDRLPAGLRDTDQIDAGGGEAVRAAAGVETFAP